jgi:hypothetical protein
MDMNQISFIFMEVNPVLWKDSYRYIAPRDFFHIDIIREVFLSPLDIDSKISMMMDNIWSWDKKIGKT